MRIHPTRRHALALAGAASAVLAAPAIAQSTWPNKPVRFVVPFPPGQAADIFARLMAEKLTDMWKQQVIVENKGGGSGIPATEYGKAAAPDGYTLMVVSSGTFGVNPSLYPDLPYKPLVDFKPVTNIIKGPLIISQSFYPNVLASKQKKIVNVSSSNGTLTGEKEVRAGTIFYRMSKAALNREMQIVAASVKKDGVTVLMFNPGPTLTEHQEYLDGKFEGILKTSFTVENMIKTAEKATIADTGKFLRYDGATEPW